jgi:uncharacterized protein with PIN domain
MVQKLGRILILCGFDARIVKQNTDIKTLIEISKNEERILITRNTKIEKFDFNDYILLREQNPYSQFKYLIEGLDLKVDENKIFTRCSICNEDLKKIEKQQVLNKIPYQTFQKTDEFYICPKCSKIYWKQSHFDFFKEKILKK